MKIVDVGPQKCDVCGAVAKYDEPTVPGGPWWYVCEKHHNPDDQYTQIKEYWDGHED